MNYTNTVVVNRVEMLLPEEYVYALAGLACVLLLTGAVACWRMQRAKREQQRLVALLRQYRAPLFADEEQANLRADQLEAQGTAVDLSEIRQSHSKAHKVKKGEHAALVQVMPTRVYAMRFIYHKCVHSCLVALRG